MVEKGESVEWSWSDAPIVLPIAFHSREWNAIYIAFYLAEYSGSKVIVTHVLEGEEEEHAFAEQLKREIGGLAKELSVRYEYSNVEPRSKPPSVEEIARSIADTADLNNAQAIVMSAHREGLFRELFGRVSDHVARFSLTDDGNASRLARRHGEDLRYSPGTGWTEWDARRWREVYTTKAGIADRVIDRARETARAIFDEATEPGLSDTDRAAIRGHGRVSLDERALRRMVALARCELGKLRR